MRAYDHTKVLTISSHLLISQSTSSIFKVESTIAEVDRNHDGPCNVRYPSLASKEEASYSFYCIRGMEADEVTLADLAKKARHMLLLLCLQVGSHSGMPIARSTISFNYPRESRNGILLPMRHRLVQLHKLHHRVWIILMGHLGRNRTSMQI